MCKERFSYSFERIAGRDREIGKERGEKLHLEAHSLNGYNGQGRSGQSLEPGASAGSPTWVAEARKPGPSHTAESESGRLGRKLAPRHGMVAL